MKKLLLVIFLGVVVSCSTPKNNILGYWYKPKTMVNVRFYPNNTFEFSDYDSAANKAQKFTGKYQLDGSNVILEFADKTTETLTVEKSTTGAKIYHLKRGDYYLIKDERVNNAVPPDASQRIHNN